MVEGEALQPRVIQKAFANVGLFPWQPKKISERVAQNVGHYTVNHDNQATVMAEITAKVLRKQLEMDPPLVDTEYRRTKVSKAKLYSPHDLMASRDLDEEERIEKHMQRVQREEQRQSQQLQLSAAKEARKCCVLTCPSYVQQLQTCAKCSVCSKPLCSLCSKKKQVPPHNCV